MPKFLVQVKYTAEGTKGVLKDGGSGRRKAVAEFIASLKGRLEEFYFTFGEDDAILIVDLPDAEAALAVAMSVRASGAIHSKMTPLLPVEEIDRAVERHVHYRPPGT
jgi:uncharacterized protein with GYD domain